ncbi:MAG: UvrD-helicase domain-containing protein [Saprospiraceae bacterium]|nr:UvrD-helicase domain-containing protein [Saprospiraceae bacterium]
MTTKTPKQSKSYLDNLNDTQRQAVTHIDGPALIIAGPGSGKTRVLTYRVAHLIESGVAPWSILTLTFTNKAAKEMKERIEHVAGENGNKIWAGTFHSVFARILRIEAPQIGFPSDFSIYDSQDSKSAISEIVKNHGLDSKVYNSSAIYSRISLAKNNLISPKAYFEDADRILEDKQHKMPYLYKIYELYVRKLKRSGAMDFDDLLYNMNLLFEKNPENVLEKYQKRFKYILVDEFQDTNQLQYSIIKKLVKYSGSTNNICVVGDDAQSIYAFRGATIQNILNFEKDFPTISVFKLEQNYRSTSYIIKAANDIIAKNRKQIPKTIFTAKEGGERIGVIHAITDTEEARQITNLIVEQKNRYQLSNDDFAILYRTNAQSRVFEEALKAQRIAYKIYGGTSFYDRKEVKDVLGYLRVIVNPRDEEALKRVINYPTRGIGATSISKLTTIAEKENLSLWTILKNVQHADLPKRTENSIKQFVAMINLFQQRVQDSSAYELATHVVKITGIIQDIKKAKTIEAQNRIENVTELLDGIKSFVEEDEIDEFSTNIEDRSILSYLQNVVLLTDIDKDQEDVKCVKLMSVHSSKGLEFKSIMIVGMEENLFPSMMALKSKNLQAAIDEERRLFYVAITRAEQWLTLSYSSSRYRFGNMTYNSSSRFLDEISPKYLDLSTKVQTAKVSQPYNRKNTMNKLSAMSKPYVKAKMMANFKASPISDAITGAEILHQRFGNGKIISIDGDGNNKVATILFEEEVGEKRIMLKYAKIQVLK